MQLFYNPQINSIEKEITFSREESKHIVKVLRKNTGDTLYITNGTGSLFECKITLATPNKCIAKGLKEIKQPVPKIKIHIAVAPTKMNDRLEWFLEKATEIGITEITPIICNHSERKVVKTERLQKIIQSAAKQSLRYHFPVINQTISFKDFITTHKNKHLFIAHCDEQKKQSLKSKIKPNNNTSYTVLIGPEGDFSIDEIRLALQNNYEPVSLGNTRLRTETAALVATHSIIFGLEE